jgi:hypothetical protein
MFALQISTERPQLFPKTTAQQLGPEHFNQRMDDLREDICHPMAGIFDDEDWEDFKRMYVRILSSKLCCQI